MEPIQLAENAKCSSISSWWALSTLVTRARLGCGRKLSGERSGGGGPIEVEIGKQSPLPVFLNTARVDGPKISEMRLEVEEVVRQIWRLPGQAASRFVGWRRHIAYVAKEAHGSFRRRFMAPPGLTCARLEICGLKVEKERWLSMTEQ